MTSHERRAGFSEDYPEPPEDIICDPEAVEGLAVPRVDEFFGQTLEVLGYPPESKQERSLVKVRSRPIKQGFNPNGDGAADRIDEVIAENKTVATMVQIRDSANFVYLSFGRHFQPEEIDGGMPILPKPSRHITGAEDLGRLQSIYFEGVYHAFDGRLGSPGGEILPTRYHYALRENDSQNENLETSGWMWDVLVSGDPVAYAIQTQTPDKQAQVMFGSCLVAEQEHWLRFDQSQI